MMAKTEELKHHVQDVEKHLGKMAMTTEWAADAELLATASLLQTGIMLWLQKGDWVLFDQNAIESGLSQGSKFDMPAIYLNHTNSNPFDYVKGIN